MYECGYTPVLFEEPNRSHNSPTDLFKHCCFSPWTMLLLKAGPMPKAGATFHRIDPSTSTSPNCKLLAAPTLSPSQAHRAEAGDTDTSWYNVSLGNDSPEKLWFGIYPTQHTGFYSGAWATLKPGLPLSCQEIRHFYHEYMAVFSLFL